LSPLEAAQGLAAALALGLSALELSAGGRVHPACVTAIRCRAQLSRQVPERLSRWRCTSPEDARSGAVPVCFASLLSAGKRSTPATSATSLAAVSVPQPTSSSSSAAPASRSVLSPRSSPLMRRVSCRQSSTSQRRSAPGPPARRGLRASARADRACSGGRAPRAGFPVPSRGRAGAIIAAGSGCGALGNEILTTIGEEPDLLLAAGEQGHWQVGLAQDGTGNCKGVDRVRLASLAPALRAPAMRPGGTRTTRSPRASRKRSSHPDTCRRSSSAHTRPSPSERALSGHARRASDGGGRQNVRWSDARANRDTTGQPTASSKLNNRVGRRRGP
jgi:hypothetical protein